MPRASAQACRGQRASTHLAVLHGPLLGLAHHAYCRLGQGPTGSLAALLLPCPVPTSSHKAQRPVVMHAALAGLAMINYPSARTGMERLDSHSFPKPVNQVPRTPTPWPQDLRHRSQHLAHTLLISHPQCGGIPVLLAFPPLPNPLALLHRPTRPHNAHTSHTAGAVPHTSHTAGGAPAGTAGDPNAPNCGSPTFALNATPHSWRTLINNHLHTGPPPHLWKGFPTPRMQDRPSLAETDPHPSHARPPLTCGKGSPPGAPPPSHPSCPTAPRHCSRGPAPLPPLHG